MQYWNDGLILVSKKKNDELYHFGIKGMKWGIRRYQNEDGSLTPAGKARYDDGTSSGASNTSGTKSTYKSSSKATASDSDQDNTKRKVKTALKVGAVVAGTALAAYGAYKVSSVIKDKAATKSLAEGRALVERSMIANGYNHSDGLANHARTTQSNYINRTHAVQKSTVTAAKYLLHPENYDVDATFVGRRHSYK